MSTEITLLHLLGKDRALFERIKPFIKEHTFSKEMSTIVRAVASYYDGNTSSSVDWSALVTHLTVTTKMSADDAEMYRAICARVEELELSSIPTEVDNIIKHYIKLDYATRIIDTAMKVVDGDKLLTLDDVLKNVVEYNKEVGGATATKDVFATTDISTVVERVASAGWEWRLEPLNLSLGPLRQKDFIIIAARPETGKTTLISSELSHFATQFDVEDERPIIWVNNEEDSDKVMFRVVQAALGCTTAAIMSDMPKAMAEYERLMGGRKDRIRILNKDSKKNNVSYLSGMFHELDPAIIVFDQLDKVHGFNKESRDDLRLGKLYEWARELTESSAVIAVSQVNGSGEGQKWIFQDQLRGSTTDKAGEADAIVTIGRVNDASMMNSRFIHVPKNKLFGGPRSEEEHRHGFFECEIKPEIARYVWSGSHGKP